MSLLWSLISIDDPVLHVHLATFCYWHWIDLGWRLRLNDFPNATGCTYTGRPSSLASFRRKPCMPWLYTWCKNENHRACKLVRARKTEGFFPFWKRHIKKKSRLVSGNPHKSRFEKKPCMVSTKPIKIQDLWSYKVFMGPSYTIVTTSIINIPLDTGFLSLASPPSARTSVCARFTLFSHTRLVP